MHNPHTSEFMEKAQMDADKLRKELLKQMPAKAKKEFKLVESCVNKMDKSNILFYLSAFLYHPSQEKPITWQYNSLVSNTKFGPDDKPTQESLDKIGIFLAGQLNNIFYEITNYYLDKNATFEQRWEFFGSFMMRALQNYYNYTKPEQGQKDLVSENKKI